MSGPAPVFETAYAKLNLALHVRERRADGYHRIETLFAFAEHGDELTAQSADDISLSITGPFAAGLSCGPDNLVVRAAEALRSAFGISRGAAIQLDKHLPIAAGIGGGSADAAAALRLLARLWELPDDQGRLLAIAKTLGADVPACVVSRTMIGTGVGDELTPIASGALAIMPVLLVNPLVACPTGPVFAAWNGVDDGPLRGSDPMAITLESVNGLEESAMALVPEIVDVRLALSDCEGLLVTRMSGSGATCFGLFESEQARGAAAAEMPGEWWILPSRLR
jgi:4-diphosphocytidyl-2-C-methyl-D-erythritol kinase